MDAYMLGEQLEEGEIVDDDDFEEISDNSIIHSISGKFVSSNETLRALSLSSDSETDKIRFARHKRKLTHRKSKIKPQKIRKKRRVSSDSSDTDVSLPNDIKGKLKEAIHIDGSEESHKNTLETRLKAMGGLVTITESLTVNAEPPCKQIDNGNNTEKVDDNELETLRMEALKTAVLNKFQRRKRRKALLEGKAESAPLETQENKENDTPKEKLNDVENNGEKVETNNAIMDLEEDEDLLRASLLAGLAKKITKVEPPKENLVETKPVAPVLPVQVAPALPKRPIINNFKSNIINKQVIQSRPKPLVKPLIINVNDDSDTEEEEVKKKAPNPASTVADLKAIAVNVEKFLKEQRAKFETETKKRFQVINKNKTILEKSAVKLLPKSQQIEYQQLLKKLRNAEKTKRARKIALQKMKTTTPPVKVLQTSQVTVEICPSRTTVEMAATTAPINNTSAPNVEVVVSPEHAVDGVKSSNEEVSNLDSSYADKESSGKESDLERRKKGMTSELTTLQRTLKEIKMQRNGSLQIKSKYQVLTPIIRKITTARNERKKQEHRISSLQQELKEARNSLAQSHQRFSTLVRELVDKKEKIDKSCQETKSKDKNKENDNATQKRANARKAGTNVANDKKGAKSAPVTSTPVKAQIEERNETTISSFVTSSTNNDCEDMDVCNSDETDMYQIDIVDPNDIDQIFKRKPAIKSTIPEYVSPLNFNLYERYKHVDPLGIMCPYEVNGSCRDIDCTYKHYLKNHERL